MTTTGEALTKAIKDHETLYPGSEVYQAEVKEQPKGSGSCRVELRASHFSVPLVYYILIA